MKVLNQALALAKLNDVEGLPKMAAIIIKRKKVLATGVNSLKSHPIMQRFADNDYKIYLHAEIDAIKNALRIYDEEELIGAEIFVARVMKNGERAIAKPCKVCQKAIEAYGITGVYWTEYDDT